MQNKDNNHYVQMKLLVTISFSGQFFHIIIKIQKEGPEKIIINFFGLFCLISHLNLVLRSSVKITMQFNKPNNI